MQMVLKGNNTRYLRRIHEKLHARVFCEVMLSRVSPDEMALLLKKKKIPKRNQVIKQTLFDITLILKVIERSLKKVYLYDPKTTFDNFYNQSCVKLCLAMLQPTCGSDVTLFVIDESSGLNAVA